MECYSYSNYLSLYCVKNTPNSMKCFMTKIVFAFHFLGSDSILGILGMCAIPSMIFVTPEVHYHDSTCHS